MICFHGTNEKNYESIMKEGTRPFTSWTPFLITALTMGGRYIVAAFFPDVDEAWLGTGAWEYCTSRVVLPENFIMTAKYDMQLLTYHGDRDKEIARWYREREGSDTCELCDGAGELNLVADGHRFRISGSRFESRGSMPIEVCPKCQGYGSLKILAKMSEK